MTEGSVGSVHIIHITTTVDGRLHKNPLSLSIIIEYASITLITIKLKRHDPQKKYRQQEELRARDKRAGYFILVFHRVLHGILYWQTAKQPSLHTPAYICKLGHTYGKSTHTVRVHIPYAIR